MADRDQPSEPFDVREIAARDLLLSATISLALLYGFLAFVLPSARPGEVTETVGLAAMLSSLLLAFCAVFWALRPPSNGFAGHAVGAVLTVALGNASLYLLLSGSASQTSSLVVLMLVAAAVVTRRTWLTVHTLLAAGTWIWTAAAGGWSEPWLSWGPLLALSFAASWLLMDVRMRTFHRLSEQHADVQRQALQLAARVEERARELVETERALEHEASQLAVATESNDQLRRALDHAGEGLVVLDGRGQIAYGNPAFEAMMQRSDSGVHSIWTLAEGDNDDELLNEVRAAISSGRAWSGRYQSSNLGVPCVRDATVTPVLDRAGKVQGAVGVIRDITREADLEQRVLQSERLDSIGRLAGGVAHDFNNLLTVVLGFAENLLGELEPGSDSWQDAQGIQQAATSAADLTRQLLVIGRKQVLRPQEIDLNTCVIRVFTLLQRVVREDIDFLCETVAQPCTVFVDPGQIEQVITNLVTNALDAMPEGGQLVVTTRLLEGNEPRVELAVRDSGKGIPAELTERVFEPFFTTKSEGRGNGLGLAQVYGIVHQSGGEVSLESQVGEGTAVRIQLPLRPAPEESPSIPGHRDAVSSEPRQRERRANVLVVEDETGVRSLVRRTLEGAGHRVFEAVDGRHGLEVARARPEIDLVLSDIIMPHLNGPKMVERLRDTCRAPVIFMTGYAGDSISGLQDEMVLQKPFQPATLLQAVHQALEHEGVPQGR